VKPALLDVDVLLALAWPNHQHHGAAHRWFSAAPRRGWATCPLTELAFVRLSSNPAFTRDAVGPADALALLERVRRLPRHRSFAELPPVAGLASFGLLGHRQVNDAYLMLVARRHHGVLATFDGGIAAWTDAAEDVVTIPA
jgi:toxin-antitoxin system PIN domain toxin